MKIFATAGAALLLTTTSAAALGLDRSGQSILPLFEDGENYVELTFGFVDPSISGNDIAAAGGTASGNVAGSFVNGSFAYKRQISDEFSAALIFDQPYGADIEYSDSSPLLGGTFADVDSTAISLIGRYEFAGGFSVHGGLRYQTINADITLAGGAFAAAGLVDFNASFASDSAFGYLAGVAYERPEIALRVSLTYFSEIDHSFDTIESSGTTQLGPESSTDVTTPEAWNLEFQTGIAPDTLLFGSVRYADYDVVNVAPSGFAANTPAGTSLTSLDSDISYTLGVGRRFNENWSGSIAFGFEDGDDNDVSPLAPTNGQYSVALGAAYDFGNGMELSGGVRYINFGSADPAVGGTTVAEFDDNDAIALGLKVGYTF